MKNLHTDQENSGRYLWQGLLKWLRPVTGLLLLGILFWIIPPQKIVRRLANANPLHISIMLLLTFTGILVSSLKLTLLIRTKAPTLSLRRIFRAYYIGSFFNNFLPGNIGGDSVKIIEIGAGLNVSLAHRIAAVVVERTTGIAVVFLLGIWATLTQKHFFDRAGIELLRWPALAICIAPFVTGLSLYLLWRKWARGFLEQHINHPLWGGIYRVIESFFVFRKTPGVLLASMALSLVFYFLQILNVMVMVSAVGGELALTESTSLIPLCRLPEALPISLGSLGIREGVFTYLVANLGSPRVIAGAAALLGRLGIWFHSAIGGTIFAFMPHENYSADVDR